mgnify:CR=1 FL=1
MTKSGQADVEAGFERVRDELDFGEPDWWHAHLSGASVTFDRGAGEVRRAHVGGEPVDPDASYTLATSAYLLYTDHEFPSLTEDHRVAGAGLQYEVLVEYARECGVAPALDGRVRFS